VLLHLYAAVLARQDQQRGSEIPTIYIPPMSPFPQLEAFIAESSSVYKLSLFRCTYSSGNNASYMKIALTAYKNKFPNIEAILIGVRRTDPHAGAICRTLARQGC
jgi:FAD synthetase